MAPAHECLGCNEPSGLEVQLRLIDGDQVAGICGTEVADELHVARARFERGLVEQPTSAPEDTGGERDFRLVQKIVRIGGVLGRARRAPGNVRFHLAVADMDRRTDGLEKPLRSRDVDDEGKGAACGHAGRGVHGAQAVGDCAQHLLCDAAAVGLCDRGKVQDLERKDLILVCVVRVADDDGRGLDEVLAVRKSGHTVVARKEPRFPLRLRAPGPFGCHRSLVPSPRVEVSEQRPTDRQAGREQPERAAGFLRARPDSGQGIERPGIEDVLELAADDRLFEGGVHPRCKFRSILADGEGVVPRPERRPDPVDVELVALDQFVRGLGREHGIIRPSMCHRLQRVEGRAGHDQLDFRCSRPPEAIVTVGILFDGHAPAAELVDGRHPAGIGGRIDRVVNEIDGARKGEIAFPLRRSDHRRDVDLPAEQACDRLRPFIEADLRLGIACPRHRAFEVDIEAGRLSIDELLEGR